MRRKLTAALIATAFLGTAWSAPSASASSSAVAWKTPNLQAGFTPQGMTYWVRPGANMIVQAEYKVGSNTRLVAVNPNDGKVYGQVSISENHAGGIAIVGGWLFVQDQPRAGSEAVRRYDMRAISAGFLASHKSGRPAFVAQAGLQELDNWQWASFMTADGAQLLSGHYGVGDGARMYRYDVDQKTGTLTVVPGYVTVPNLVQGVAMNGKTPVFASYLQLQDGTRNILIPAHAEGLVILKGTAYVAFEGGAKNVLKFKL